MPSIRYSQCNGTYTRQTHRPTHNLSICTWLSAWSHLDLTYFLPEMVIRLSVDALAHVLTDVSKHVSTNASVWIEFITSTLLKAPTHFWPLTRKHIQTFCNSKMIFLKGSLTPTRQYSPWRKAEVSSLSAWGTTLSLYSFPGPGLVLSSTFSFGIKLSMENCSSNSSE